MNRRLRRFLVRNALMLLMFASGLAIPALADDGPAAAVATVDCVPWKPAGRGGYLLPDSYVSTDGNQIVDDDGNAVRIASIGWDGGEGRAGAAPQGLWSESYAAILDSIKAAGFNTVRLPWSDVNLDVYPANTPQAGTIDFNKNHELKNLTIAQILRKLTDYAGHIGLKIIFDHHSNEGCCGQQPNGLWFDVGPGTDGTDRGGSTGTVTAAKFEQDWLRFAHEYAGNTTVIGFDLDNEPTSVGNIKWGGAGPSDIKMAMEHVGNAILAVDPGVLIIIEGPQTYKLPAADAGMYGRAPEGNLTGVARRPVILTPPHKLVYSVHEYPNEIADFAGPDSGPEFIRRMNSVWGWLVKANVAPVWIGEMGSSMRSSGSRLWADTLLDYMNGKLASLDGLSFTNEQQPVGGSWWHIGPASDQPDGIQTAWGVGHYRTEQLAVTDQMLFHPNRPRQCTHATLHPPVDTN